MSDDPQERLHAAAAAISTAAMVLRSEQPIMTAFLEEVRRMDSFGHIIDPTLFRDPQRRAASAIMKPMFEAALEFLRVHDEQVVRARAGLEKVRA